MNTIRQDAYIEDQKLIRDLNDQVELLSTQLFQVLFSLELDRKSIPDHLLFWFQLEKAKRVRHIPVVSESGCET